MSYRQLPTAIDVPNKRVRELFTERPYWEQGSDAWFEARTKYLTASPLAGIIKYGYGSRAELFRRKTSPIGPRISSPACEWGSFYEDAAVDKYEKEFKTHVLLFSLIPHDTKTWLAISPDGITTDGTMVEVKCPYSRKIKTAEEYAPWGCPKQYYPQVQAQLEVCDLELCHFVQYDARTDHMLVTDVHRDRDWWAEHEPKFKAFWEEVLEFRKEHPDWQTVDHHPPRPNKRKRELISLTHESELSDSHKQLHDVVHSHIEFPVHSAEYDNEANSIIETAIDF